MKLFEHPDFKDLINAAKQEFTHLGLTEQFIEKDYYITEALRIVAMHYPGQVIFKGGTSLSKGWKLIERFSEDIDLFLNRKSFSPNLGGNKVDKCLKEIEVLVSNHPGLTLLTEEYRRKRGVNRNSLFSYKQEFNDNIAIPSRIKLEMGTRSGTYPTKKVLLSSYVAEFLEKTNDSLKCEDESSFSMYLLHFRRTFVEKLFAIHSKVMAYKEKGEAINTYARHYYDLYCLTQKLEVMEMIKSEEYDQIKQDCNKISKENKFPDYYPPYDLKFSNSEALFPTEQLGQTLAKEYENQCKSLCYGNYPSWEEVESCFEELKDLL